MTGSGPVAVVVGCGNLLRGDDGVGPRLVRRLWEQGVPDGVELVDGGTAGMDAAFKMRGARRVVIVDASATGAAPGTIYRVPGEVLEALPPPAVHGSHAFRWDHALAFARWLLKDEYPEDVAVFLVEAAQVEHGADLSPAVRDAMERVCDLIRAEFGAVDPAAPRVVEVRPDGSLAVPDALVEEVFAGVPPGLLRRGAELWLVPAAHEAGTPLGEARLGREVAPGPYPCTWDPAQGAVVIPLPAAVSAR